MKNIIKRVLKEFVESKDVTLLEIFIDPYDLILSEGKSFVKIPNGTESVLLRKIESYYNWPPTVNKIWCSDIKEKFKEGIPIKSCLKKFELSLTNHWIQRLFRTSEDDYKLLNPRTGNVGKFYNPSIVNPDIFEGIELFFNSKDKINDFIDNSKNWIPLSSKFIILKSKTYQTIIELKKMDQGSYRVIFITQIKGVPFFDTPELKKSRLIK
jgi:hypothetical protein